MKARVRICIIAILLAAFSALPAFSQRLGADLAAPTIAEFLTALPLKEKSTYTFTDADTERVIALAADIHINVFEIIDCVFRYVNPRSVRIVIQGSSLRKLQTKYDLGGERVLAILSIEKFSFLETGARLKPGQKDLDIYLQSPISKYIEIGTAIFQTRYGFETLRPLVFEGAYGITVKKLILSTPLEKLELFSPGKGAIYVQGLSRPKKWNLDVITVINR